MTGNVYVDLNNNGVLDAGEAAISGVTITLTGTDDRGQAVSTTATSDAAGAYAFANLRPGTYTVTETQPAAYLDGKDTAGSPGGGVATNDAISGITLGSGITSAGNIFGELPAASVSGVGLCRCQQRRRFQCRRNRPPRRHDHPHGHRRSRPAR